ncbi:hypothetical protein [Rugamonas apoptosis]|uniref:Uncharacterized protein n=1 Tax=Rugamonas apoptosis TaxID=2758570 RepID=A0A7W2F7S5_9BURK|nr:hypothetical protein [Rugamonas apoptosis]MBA5686692.1 hypothetical protein [Rugamonas apoptosis]
MSKKFKLLSVNNPGKLSSEHVWLEAIEDVDIGDYVLMDSTFGSDHQASNENRHSFLFPPKTVKQGEFVSLRTRSGEDKVFVNESKQVIHAIHWNHQKTVWNKDGDTAYLLYAPKASRQSKSVPAQE